MMTLIEWDSIGLGLAIGAVASLLFFAGLAMGMRLALKRDNTTAILLVSAAIRIALLLWLGSWVATQGAPALIGFALAFILTRFIITALIRPGKSQEPAQWN